MHLQGAGRGRFPECLVNVDTRAWFTLSSTGGVDDDVDDDGADDDLTQGPGSPFLLQVELIMMKTMIMLQLSHKGYDLPFFMHSQMLGMINLLLPYVSVSFFLPNADFEDSILFDC